MTMVYFSSQGTLVYDPVAGRIKNKWWLNLECPLDIIEYYSYWLEKEAGIITKIPRFGSHISVIRSEEPPDAYKHLWGKYDGKTFTFEYHPIPRGTNEHWWLDVRCPHMSQLRNELGLSRKPLNGFHLTIGRVIERKKIKESKNDEIQKLLKEYKMHINFMDTMQRNNYKFVENYIRFQKRKYPDFWEVDCVSFLEDVIVLQKNLRKVMSFEI
ncbi:hypothetical protein [Aneurinibacillus migulanus]|uniref:hypothetical protein n=1 Tax=Aneurinibacillus migulanus TaxID=47500 RepID=UPI001F3DDE63|nr:hypothetical protein [Aneurinibacillus migulanus]